jgi:hypothetical protein
MPYALELEHFAVQVKACRKEGGHVDWAENMLESVHRVLNIRGS